MTENYDSKISLHCDTPTNAQILATIGYMINQNIIQNVGVEL